MDFLPRPAQLEDWLVARWALLRIERLREPFPERAAALEALFTPQLIRGLMARESPDTLLLLFRALSTEALAPLVDELLGQWQELPRVLGWHIAERLAKAAPERLTESLEQWLAEHPLNHELLSLTSLAGTLLALPAGHGAELADKVANFALGFGDVYLLDLLRPELIELGQRHGLPWTVRLVKGLFEPGHVNRYLYSDALLHGYEALTGGLPYYDLLVRRARGESQQDLEPLAPLFQPEAPLAAIQAAFLQGPLVALERMVALLPAPPAAEIARTLLAQSQNLADTPSSHATSVFLVALTLAAWARPKPDWGSLSATQIAALGVADLSSLPDSDGALDRLRGLPQAEVCASLEAALLENEESQGAAMLAAWMGKLRYPELIQPLRANLDSAISDKLADAACDALKHFGPEIEPGLVSRWDDLTEAQQDYGAELLALHGGEATVGLLIERRADLHQDEPRDLWTRIAWGLPDPRLAEILEEDADDWDDPYLEEAYLMQCLLLEREGQNLEPIRADVEKRLFMDKDEDEYEYKAPLVEPAPVLMVELVCGSCGATASYPDPQVYVDFDHPTEKPVVNGQTECSSCGETEVLQPTADGLEAIQTRCRELEAKHWEPRSLANLPIQLMDGSTVPIGKALSTYELALEAHPNSPIDLFMLARCSHSAGFPKRSAELFRKCLAAEPAYVQAALDLARILATWKTEGAALEILDRARPHKDRWQLFRTVDHATEADLKRDFVELYNGLRETAQDDSRPRLHVSDLATAKAGRNDPCPCGSGKKYKKCCLLKEQ